MKARPRKHIKDGDGSCDVDCSPEEATHIWLHFPGPANYIRLPVVLEGAARKGAPCWTWNGNTEKPTLKPSVKTTGHNSSYLCHSFVTDGKVKFLSDSTHEFAGQTVDLLDVELFRG